MRKTIGSLKPPKSGTAAQTVPQPAIPLPPPGQKAAAVGQDSTAKQDSPPARRQVVIRLELEAITPVIGGGVSAREPDLVDRVRIPAIRGQLRKWWRALEPLSAKQGSSEQNVVDSTSLFKQEAELWGGIELPKEAKEARGSKEPDTRRSRVSLRLLGVPSFADKPAGRYEGSRGQYRAIPSWEGGAELGYALFPLQYERNELRQITTIDPPTRDLRHGLAFKLEVVLSLLPDQSLRVEVQRLLATLWAWITFGGLGARTTRGFGALALQEKDRQVILPTLELVTPSGSRSEKSDQDELRALRQTIRECFTPPTSQKVSTWLSEGMNKLFQSSHETRTSNEHCPFPRLPPRALLVGAPRPSALEALKGCLGRFKHFRQAEGFARRRGSQQGRPGRSFWPEPDTLRRLAQKMRKAKFTTHPPLSPDATFDGAPRAGFGMPLNIAFKDNDDQVANGMLVPAFDGRRWTSPLLLRPLRIQDGQVVMLVIRLWQAPPAHVKIAGLNKPQVAGVLPKTGRPKYDPEVEQPVPLYHAELSDKDANTPLRAILKNAQGDAVAAFLTWLVSQGYSKVVQGDTP